MAHGDDPHEMGSLGGLMAIKFNLDVNPRLSWMPALDGLRGIAVIAVMMFHTPGRAWLPGGSLGVDLFFVLSGFLITTLLLQEHVATGRISLRGFYVRRARRLLPAVVALLAIYAVVVTLAPGDFTGNPQAGQVAVTYVAVATYILNVTQMAHLAVAPGLSHLWSLSVEEQFYLVWPALLVLCLGWE
jgi:peptidoglycan/LPS O-acetylase OafA/YrhL